MKITLFFLSLILFSCSSTRAAFIYSEEREEMFDIDITPMSLDELLAPRKQKESVFNNCTRLTPNTFPTKAIDNQKMLFQTRMEHASKDWRVISMCARQHSGRKCVPEPATLIIFGLGGLSLLKKRK